MKHIDHGHTSALGGHGLGVPSGVTASLGMAGMSLAKCCTAFRSRAFLLRAWDVDRGLESIGCLPR